MPTDVGSGYGSPVRKKKPRSMPKPGRAVAAAKKASPKLTGTANAMTRGQGKKVGLSKREVAAAKTVRKVTRAAVRKGISGPTEDSLGITRQEGGRKVRRALKVLGSERATKIATKTRLRKGQTYKGGEGWISPNAAGKKRRGSIPKRRGPR